MQAFLPKLHPGTKMSTPMQQESFEKAVKALNATPGKNPNTAYGRCPCHDDKHASLSISFVDGKLLFHCHAGCSQDALVAEFRKLGILTGGHTEKPTPVIPDSFRGLPLTLLTRFRDGSYEARYQNGSGHKEIRPYLPDGTCSAPKRKPWAAIGEGEEVWIVEGPKCAHAISEAGQTGVCWMGGAAAVDHADWHDLFCLLSELKPKRVVLWPDNDAPGLKAMDTVAAQLRERKIRFEVVHPYKRWPEKADCYDILREGIPLSSIVTSPADVEEEWMFMHPNNAYNPSYIIPHCVPTHRLSIVYGEGKAGKSLCLATKLAATDAQVLYGLSDADAIHSIYRNYLASGGDEERIKFVEWKHSIEPLSLARFAVRNGFGVLVLDIMRLWLHVDENKAELIAPVLSELKSFCVRHFLTIILVHHAVKSKSLYSCDSSFAGSGAIKAACTSGIFVGRTKNGVRIWAHQWNQGGPQDPVTPFTIDDQGIVRLQTPVEVDADAYLQDQEEEAAAKRRRSKWEGLVGKSLELLSGAGGSMKCEEFREELGLKNIVEGNHFYTRFLKPAGVKARQYSDGWYYTLSGDTTHSTS